MPSNHHNEEVMAEFDAYAANYTDALDKGLKLTGESKEYFAEGRIDWVKRRLGTSAAQMKRALDFGCGTGTSCSYLQHGFGLTHYLGYDPSASSIQEARAENTVSTAQFEHASEAVPANAFDLAFTNGVFHHIPPEHRAEAMALVWRSLKPGGYFAFWENNRWNPMVHFIMSRVPFDQDAQMLFPHQARQLLRDAGFDITLTDYLFIFPAALKFLRSLEPTLCKLPLGGQYLVLARKPLSSPSLSPSPA